MDFTKTTGAESIMTFDSHGLGDGWHIPENEDEQDVEEKQVPGVEAWGCNTLCKLSSSQ